MNLRNLIILTVVLAVLVPASADNGEVTFSGATQFDWFFSFEDNFPAATHDYIDVDNDGVKTPDIDQLATTYTGSETEQQLLELGPWIINYRGIGSGTGLKELIAYYDSSPDCNVLPDVDGTVNRWEYSISCLYPFDPVDRIDIAVMDVPASQFVSVGSEEDAFPCRRPYEEGYGMSCVTPWDANSTNKLADMGVLNINVSDPDAETIFDYPVGWLPFCFVASSSTGLQDVTTHQLASLYLTGRMPCGINYNVGTRHSGSGTRNACMSSIGVDPSWGRGDNLGETGKGTEKEILGPNHQINNITSSSTLRDCHRNNRFMVSYQSLYGSKGVPKINSGWYECLNVSFDCGKTYVRPEDTVSLNEIPDFAEAYNDGEHPWFQSNIFWPNASNGWRIGGSETFASVGDPYATDLPAHLDEYETATHGFGMRNQDAAEYMVNLIESIKDVQELGPSPATAGSPGQALASKAILVAGIYGIPNPACPTQYVVDPCLYNPALTGLPIGNAGLEPYGSNGYGLLPDRDTDGDGDSDGADAPYRNLADTFDVTAITWDANYALQGDIDKNLIWDACDISLAVQIIENGASAPVDTDISYDIKCDFDGDGWFTKEDVRFMADGVILSPVTKGDKCLTACACTCCTDVVCRLNNFIVVDEVSSSGNFFGTTLAHGTYDVGDSRADIAKLVGGNIYAQAGAAPVADLVVNQTDISYIQKVLTGRLLGDIAKYDVPARGLCWMDALDRVYADYSCDMNNDLLINNEDLRIVVEDILETELGDFDLDGAKDADDRQTIINHIGQQGTYVNGDLTGDGVVNGADLASFDGVELPSMDTNGDGFVGFADFAEFAAQWLTGVYY